MVLFHKNLKKDFFAFAVHDYKFKNIVKRISKKSRKWKN